MRRRDFLQRTTGLLITAHLMQFRVDRFPTVLIQRLDVVNRNGRIYSTEVMRRAIRKQEGAPVAGHLGMTPDLRTHMDLLSHWVSNLRIKSGWLIGDVEFANTPNGRVLASIPRNRVAYALNGWGLMKDRASIEYHICSINAIGATERA